MIAPVPFFAPRGTPISILGRLRVLSSLGHEVDLITYPVGKDIFIPGVRIYRTTNFRFIKEVPVGPSWIKLLFDIFVIIRAVRMLRSTRYDLLHSHEEACVFVSVLCKVFKVPHLYDFHSSIPQALGNFGYDKFPFLISFFEWIERIVIRTSSALIAASPELANYVRKRDNNVPLVVIEDIFESVDSRSVSEESVRRLSEEFSLLDGKKIVLYVGTFERYQGLDLLVDSAEVLSKRINTVKFVLVGGNPNQIQRYRDKASERGLSSFFLFTGTRPPEEIPVFINIANMLVSTRIKGENTPSKIYSYLHSGKPIVATNHISQTQVLNSEIAYLVEPNPEDIAEGIIHILENPDLGEAMGARARKFFEENYHYENLVDATDKILQLAIR